MSGITSRAGTLFFAVGPDPDTASRIYRSAGILKRARQFEGEITRPDRLHVTLFFLGDRRDLSEHVIRMACEAVADVRMLPFEVSFDRTASFRGQPGRHPFVLLGDNGLRQLMSLRQMLGAAMTKKGLRWLVNAEFTPHVTLLYDKRNVEEQPIEPISWTVTEFVLTHSMRGHIHLARWPLRG
jgi:RNA 2',3'-cyclic 3'-phosphodiesterase